MKEFDLIAQAPFEEASHVLITIRPNIAVRKTHPTHEKMTFNPKYVTK